MLPSRRPTHAPRALHKHSPTPAPLHPCALASLQVVSSQFTKSVIRSRAALTYAEAQSRIDDQRLTDELSVGARVAMGWRGLGGGHKHALGKQVHTLLARRTRSAATYRPVFTSSLRLPGQPAHAQRAGQDSAAQARGARRALGAPAAWLRGAAGLGARPSGGAALLPYGPPAAPLPTYLPDHLPFSIAQPHRSALQLASPEVKFEIDTETHDPLDVGMYQVGAQQSGAGLGGVHSGQLKRRRRRRRWFACPAE